MALVTKASFVNLSSPAPSNPTNPANCLILLAYTSTHSPAHLTMVNFLYAVNAPFVNASLSQSIPLQVQWLQAGDVIYLLKSFHKPDFF